MGIYDRTYMNDGESGSGMSRRFSAVAITIAVNAIVWILWRIAESNNYQLREFMANNFLVHPYGVLKEWRIHTLFTMAISHIQFMHILFNMYFIWLLGTEVEAIYGRRNFYWIYFFTGVLASIAFVGMEYLRTGGNLEMAHPALGASGAAMGIAVIAAMLEPDKPMLLMGIIEMRLKWLVLIYLGFDLLGILQTNSTNMMGGRTAYAAHLGGALAGFLYYKLDLRLFQSVGRSQTGILNALRRLFRRKPKLRVLEKADVPDAMPREAVATAERVNRANAAAVSGSARVDQATSQRVDELLVKISRQGMDSLTEEERSFLKESSQKYKKPT